METDVVSVPLVASPSGTSVAVVMVVVHETVPTSIVPFLAAGVVLAAGTARETAAREQAPRTVRNAVVRRLVRLIVIAATVGMNVPGARLFRRV
jgi:hypothetical protein